MLSPHADLGFVQLLDEKARTRPDAVYASCDGEQLTFRQLQVDALRWQQHFADQGLKPGDRVGSMLSNSFDAIALVFAILRAELVWLPINTALRGPNLEHLVNHAGPRIIVCEHELFDLLSECSLPESTVIVRRLGDSRFSIPLPAQADAEIHSAAAPDDGSSAALIYTSGTTGPPKGVVVTHAMLRVAAEAGLLASRGGDGDVFFYWESMGHVGGAQVLLFPLLRDIRLAMVRRFSASRFWDQVRAAGASHIHYLGGILQMLLNQPERPDDRSHPARIAWGGGCSREVFAAFAQRFGVELYECYGMTEASSIATVADGGRPGSVGRALPWIRVSVVDGDGRSASPGEQGEIVLETTLPKAFFSGYFENPEATSRALRNGRLHTGDLGRLDEEGNLFYLGRLTESLRCRGENVSAWEVEHVLMSHPAVEAAAVLGVDAEVGEQDIMAFIEFGDPEPPAFEELAEWLATRLAKYQLPRYFKAVQAFERTASQRIKKHQLDSAVESSWDRLGS